MLDAARTAVLAAQGRSRNDLERDRVWALGIVKCIEIIGEAAGRVSNETRAAVKGLPWGKIVAMRNRLVHGYFEVDYDQVWIAVSKELPLLVEELSRSVNRTSQQDCSE